MSLLLQARMLRTSQLQLAQATQFQLIRMSIEHPYAVPTPCRSFGQGPETYAQRVYLNDGEGLANWLFSCGLSVEGVWLQCDRFFTAAFRRDWWSLAIVLSAGGHDAKAS